MVNTKYCSTKYGYNKYDGHQIRLHQIRWTTKLYIKTSRRACKITHSCKSNKSNIFSSCGNNVVQLCRDDMRDRFFLFFSFRVASLAELISVFTLITLQGVAYSFSCFTIGPNQRLVSTLPASISRSRLYMRTYIHIYFRV